MRESQVIRSNKIYH